MGKSAKFLAVILSALLIVSCGGSDTDTPQPTETGNDPIADAVQQTVAAIAVAQTVAALTTPPAGVTAPPTPIVLATPTVAPSLPTATSIVVPPTAAPPTAPLPTAVLPTAIPPTAIPPTATPTATATRANLPPVVENDAPGGSFPEDGSVTFNIIVDPTFLFRMDVRVLSVGDFEGVGIESVGFSISGNGVDYFREERTAGFCVFGGGEPICNPWPKNDQGQYTWGAGGPVVESGDYFVNMSVTADEPDDEFFGNWNWNFPFRVTLP